ncbi:UNKNOWN [Stylonychia lemnae]|uniref:Uncharacterized protein n=1 Tax=Stylonychia lemnae TaxID=5949 RepID=A0A078AZD2_STYLE|nr:UNKNOWN [Stylonychia lemnae]|eukprot:CDW86173.1 UNKNOWN [Stylonychia lemnae]
MKFPSNFQANQNPGKQSQQLSALSLKEQQQNTYKNSVEAQGFIGQSQVENIIYTSTDTSQLQNQFLKNQLGVNQDLNKKSNALIRKRSDSMFSDESCDSESGVNNRISTRSKVNFSKLSNEEKILRLTNMALKIKKLKQQVRQMKMNKSKQIRKQTSLGSQQINLNHRDPSLSNGNNLLSTQQQNMISQEKGSQQFSYPSQTYNNIASLQNYQKIQLNPQQAEHLSMEYNEGLGFKKYQSSDKPELLQQKQSQTPFKDNLYINQIAPISNRANGFINQKIKDFSKNSDSSEGFQIMQASGKGNSLQILQPGSDYFEKLRQNIINYPINIQQFKQRQPEQNINQDNLQFNQQNFVYTAQLNQQTQSDHNQNPQHQQADLEQLMFEFQQYNKNSC